VSTYIENSSTTITSQPILSNAPKQYLTPENQIPFYVVLDFVPELRLPNGCVTYCCGADPNVRLLQPNCPKRAAFPHCLAAVMVYAESLF